MLIHYPLPCCYRECIEKEKQGKEQKSVIILLREVESLYPQFCHTYHTYHYPPVYTQHSLTKEINVVNILWLSDVFDVYSMFNISFVSSNRYVIMLVVSAVLVLLHHSHSCVQLCHSSLISSTPIQLSKLSVLISHASTLPTVCKSLISVLYVGCTQTMLRDSC